MLVSKFFHSLPFLPLTLSTSRFCSYQQHCFLSFFSFFDHLFYFFCPSMPHSLSPSLLSVFPINHDCITGRRKKCGMNQREKWQRSSSGVSAPVYQSSTTSMSQNIKHKTVLFKKAQSQITINNNRETEKQHQWSQCSVWVLFCLLRFSLAVVDRTYSTHMQASRPANMWYQLKDKQTNKMLNATREQTQTVRLK